MWEASQAIHEIANAIDNLANTLLIMPFLCMLNVLLFVKLKQYITPKNEQTTAP